MRCAQDIVREGFLEAGASGGATRWLLSPGILQRGLCPVCSPSPTFFDLASLSRAVVTRMVLNGLEEAPVD